MDNIRELARPRILLGLLQGLLLYYIYDSAQAGTWPATQPLSFGPAVLVSTFVPLLGISAWGRLSHRGWLQWLGVAALLIAALGFYDIWRMNPLQETRLGYKREHGSPSLQAWIFFAVGLVMAHALVLSSGQDHRRIAAYSTYFDQSWKLCIQHVFSAAFVGALWLVLHLGAALFGLIGLKFMEHLLHESWFAIPVTTFAAACALHLTDIKPEIVRGIRGLLLVLMSWILPLMVVLTSGFLLSLPVTGLQALWGTRSASAVLLSTAAGLVILINTAFQNGERSEQLSRVVRAFARLACVLLLPVVGLAAYGLSQRVGQYGWSSDRVIAAACCLVASCYALGYGWAAVPRGRAWLAPLAAVNIGVSWVILAVLVALLSPLADPARLAVNDQLARLRDGRTTAEKFDYHYLRFDAGRHGYDALQALADSSASESEASAASELTIRYAKAALQSKQRYSGGQPNIVLDAPAVRENIKAVWPEGSELPESFWQAQWLSGEAESRDWRLPQCLTQFGVSCEAVRLQLGAKDTLQVLLIQSSAPGRAVLMEQDEKGIWQVVAVLPSRLATCEADRERLRTGQFEYVTPSYKDLKLGDWQVNINAEREWKRKSGMTPGGCE